MSQNDGEIAVLPYVKGHGKLDGTVARLVAVQINAQETHSRPLIARVTPHYVMNDQMDGLDNGNTVVPFLRLAPVPLEDRAQLFLLAALKRKYVKSGYSGRCRGLHLIHSVFFRGDFLDHKVILLD